MIRSQLITQLLEVNKLLYGLNGYTFEKMHMLVLLDVLNNRDTQRFF